MNYYYDENGNCIVSEKQLEEEFNALKNAQPDEYNYTFSEYIANCTSKNGFLRKVSYYLIDYYTEEIVNVFTDVENAITACKATQDSQVKTENNVIVYSNVDLPF